MKKTLTERLVNAEVNMEAYAAMTCMTPALVVIATNIHN